MSKNSHVLVQHKSPLAKMEASIRLRNDLFMIQQQKKWYLVEEEVNKKTRIYSRKEVAKILKTSKFTDLTINLAKMGIFSLAHYFCFKNQKKKNLDEFWTDDGIDILKDLLIISKEEEEEYIAHYYFVSEMIGEKEMFSVITERYNKMYPNDPREALSVENYMSSSWGSFSSKNKDSFDKFFTILKKLKDDIEEEKDIYWLNNESKKEELLIFSNQITYEDMLTS